MIGKEKLVEISQKLSLPYWWIESVAVEYCNCRRYAENEELWSFDFSKLDENDIKLISTAKVVIPNYYIVQNVRPKDLAKRSLIVIAGLPFIPLDEADLIPEGLINYSGFPSPIRNSIDIWDHKLDFNQRALVFDEGVFYQWTITETYEIKEEHRMWHKSNLFDLVELDNINRRLQTYRNDPLIKKPTPEFISKIENEYKLLEDERWKIRKKILEYHNKMKSQYNPGDANVSKPPMLSYFDAIKLTDDGYQVKTHLEPILLRSAIRNVKKAESARMKLDSDPDDYDALLDEIEYSSMCIIASTNCLESYINFVIRKYLPVESKVFDDTSSHRQKWLWVPAALNLPFRFNPAESPFQDFSNLVKWRNNVIHHVPEYRRVRGESSQTFNQFNFENAKLAIKTVKSMVTKLSEGDKIPLPIWIKTDMGGATYWDEVRQYLTNLP